MIKEYFNKNQYLFHDLQKGCIFVKNNALSTH